MRVVVKMDNVIRTLRKAKRKAENMLPLSRMIANQLKKTVMRNFEAQGRPTKWKPLSPRYRAWKKEHGYTDKILVRTGRLRQSINTRYTNDEAAVYTGVKYGVLHQTGTRRLPKRPFLVLPNEDLPIYERIVHDWVAGIWR